MREKKKRVGKSLPNSFLISYLIPCFLIFRSSCHFIRLEDDFFFASQFGFDLGDDQSQVSIVGDVIQVIGRDGEDGAEGEVVDPAFVEVVEVLQVVGSDGAFVVAPAVVDAVEEGIYRGAQINNKVGRGQELNGGFVQVTIGLIIAVGHVALLVEIVGKDLGILVHTAVLNHRIGMLSQVEMSTEAVSEEEDLGMECPGRHILVKVSEIRVLCNRFVEWVPTHLITKHLDERGLSNTDVSRDGYKSFHGILSEWMWVYSFYLTTGIKIGVEF